MIGHSLRRRIAASIAVAVLGAASTVQAQTAARPGGPTAAPAAAPDAGQADDRVFALVQAGKCAQAKAAALRQNDLNLAQQIGLMCGARSSGAPSKGGGEGRRGGMGASGGRRGGV